MAATVSQYPTRRDRIIVLRPARDATTPGDGPGARTEQPEDAAPSRPEAYAANARLRTSRGWGPAVRGAPPDVEGRRGARTTGCDGQRPGPAAGRPQTTRA